MGDPNITGVPTQFPEAAGKLATFGTTLVTETGNLARCMGRIVGTVPEDAVGFLIGDPLHAIRSLAAGWYDIKVSEILERRKAKTQPVSLSVAIPLIRGAYDETREGLREMWAELIANSMDSERRDRVRLSFIEALKRFDPLDALILSERYNQADMNLQPSAAQFLSTKLSISIDEVMISVENLRDLRCVANPQGAAHFVVTPAGRGLLRACSE